MKTYSLVSILILITFISCDQGGTVSSFSEEGQTPAVSPSKDSNPNQLHTVVVDEVLPAKKYVYIHVTEGAEQFWVATAKKEIGVGDTYFFRGGLLKTNFESKEYNRMFKKIYLVSQFVPANHGGNSGALSGNKIKLPEDSSPDKEDAKTVKKIEKAGSMKIAELVEDPQKYEGQTVQLSGECVKINPKIMGRNWIHLKDGSKDDFDLVITSDIFVPEGTVITIKAKVTLNKDFGAGYQYDLILEDGILVD